MQCHVIHIRLFANEAEYDDTGAASTTQVVQIIDS